jgi:hypothetical protein
MRTGAKSGFLERRILRMMRDTWAIRTRVLTHTVGAALAVASSFLATAHSAEPLWRQIMPRKKVAADPNADYTLTEQNGPWLIMAASFNGERGEDDAKALVMELRERFNLPAYYYGMTFKIGDERIGRGIDEYGAPIRRRYNRGNEVLEHAVLVGEFPAIDDPEGQSLLERIKTIEPDVLKTDASEITTQNLAAARQFYKSVKQSLNNKAMPAGPMSHAFISRNPLLPKEYFTPGLDPFIVELNKGLDYSLLKCPKKYTIKVATFRGRTTLQKTTDAVDESARSRWAKDDDPLIVAAKNAHKLTIALRSKGWEAYEFHDQHESYVTIGGYDEMQDLGDGRLAASTREAQIVVNTFGASTPNIGFERPAYDALGMDAQDIQKVQADEAAIEQQYDQWMGGVKGGFHPKQFVGLPFDIQPAPIVAPKESISSAYARR